MQQKNKNKPWNFRGGRYSDWQLDSPPIKTRTMVTLKLIIRFYPNKNT